MVIRLTVVVGGVLVFVTVLSAWCSSLSAAWGPEPPLEAVAVVMQAAGPGEEEPAYAYVGTKKCKTCHLHQHKSWAKTKMANAYETLKPGKDAEAKDRSGLDVHKDYTKDESCLKCHTTGYGKPGGYAIPDPKNKKAVRRAKTLEGIGCESCHGPGAEYVKVLEEIDKSRRKYRVEELYAVGMRKIEETTCLVCHTEDIATFDPDKPFVYEKALEEDTHKHKPLRMREP